MSFSMIRGTWFDIHLIIHWVYWLLGRRWNGKEREEEGSGMREGEKEGKWERDREKGEREGEMEKRGRKWKGERGRRRRVREREGERGVEGGEKERGREGLEGVEVEGRWKWEGAGVVCGSTCMCCILSKGYVDMK